MNKLQNFFGCLIMMAICALPLWAVIIVIQFLADLFQR